MNNILKYSIFLIIFSPLIVKGQQTGKKYEREEKIKLEDFPDSSLELIAPIMENSKKEKFYKEYGKDTYFFEYKSTFNEEEISIKFFKNGKLKDIEVIADYDQIPQNVRDSINQHFKLRCKKHKFRKIQIQYNRLEESDVDKEYLNYFLNMDRTQLQLKYEIEAEIIENDNERGFYEFLFDEEGKLEQKLKIDIRSDDNLLY